MLSLINVLSARLDEFCFIASITDNYFQNVLKCNLETREHGNMDNFESVFFFFKQACFFVVSKGETRPDPNLWRWKLIFLYKSSANSGKKKIKKNI